MAGNTVEILGEGADTSLSFIHYGMTLSTNQQAMIAGMLRHTEQQILKYLDQGPPQAYPDNCVTEDRLMGYTDSP